MKRPTEIYRIMKAFFICVILSLCLMFSFMGFFKAGSNSEYALNGKKTEYVTGTFFTFGL